MGLPITNKWIGIKEALQISRSYPKGPNTKEGLIWAGKKAGFIQKASLSVKWLFNRKALRRYCELSGKPTLRGIADLLQTNVGAIKYLALKNNIQFKVEMKRKYLELEDADRIIKLYKESNHGKRA